MGMESFSKALLWKFGELFLDSRTSYALHDTSLSTLVTMHVVKSRLVVVMLEHRVFRELPLYFLPC